GEGEEQNVTGAAAGRAVARAGEGASVKGNGKPGAASDDRNAVRAEARNRCTDQLDRAVARSFVGTVEYDAVGVAGAAVAGDIQTFEANCVGAAKHRARIDLERAVAAGIDRGGTAHR